MRYFFKKSFDLVQLNAFLTHFPPLNNENTGQGTKKAAQVLPILYNSPCWLTGVIIS